MLDPLSLEDSKPKAITLKLPSHLVSVIDRLKGEYGVRARGQVLEILLENLLGGADRDALETESPPEEDAGHSQSGVALGDANHEQSIHDAESDPGSDDGPDAKSLVLIRPTDAGQNEEIVEPVQEPTGSIDLPGFVRRRTSQLRETLQSPKRALERDDTLLLQVSIHDLETAGQVAEQHWRSLYGQPPGETVVEASMLWLARDLWPNLDASDGRAFTWSAANAAMEELCKGWASAAPTLGRVMVIAGTLEDPFATAALAERMPTLVRRFVNRFRRSRQVTSFETLESTMTVHGALKLLGLSTQAGASVTLSSIREAYKTQALATHPDAGGSTDAMRRLNEAYQLLRELYRQRGLSVSNETCTESR